LLVLYSAFILMRQQMEADLVVLKFGGSSVAEVAHWNTIGKCVQNQLDKGNRPLLVLSALRNVSNLLEALLHQALSGVYIRAVNHLRELHNGFASQLGLNIHQSLEPWFIQLESDCEAINSSHTISPKLHARVLAIGELLSTTIGSEFLTQQGFDVCWQDARDILKSGDKSDPWHHYTSAQCDYQPNKLNELNLFPNWQSLTPIIVTQGFIASDKHQDTVLLGREGSDTSASYLAALLKAQKLEIWTDVTGVFSANPKEIPNALQLPNLSYRQASLMARFGAKVLHQRAMQPMAENSIDINVRCTSDPEHPGTFISDRGAENLPIVAVVVESDICQIKFAKFGCDSERSQFRQSITKFGYDTLLKYLTDSQEHWLLNYTNSDLAQPESREIQGLIRNRLSINSNCALVTLIGEPRKLLWKAKAMDFIRQWNSSEILDIYPNKRNDRLSILLTSDNYLDFYQKLHQSVIG